VRFEFCIIQILDGPFHIIPLHEFHNTCSIVEGIGVRDIPGFAHEVLDVLPRAGWGQTCDGAPVVGSLGRWTPPSPGAAAAISAAAAIRRPSPERALGFSRRAPDAHAQYFIAVAAANRIFRVPGIFELDEREAGNSTIARLFHVHIPDVSVLLKRVTQVVTSSVLSQVTHIHTAILTSVAAAHLVLEVAVEAGVYFL